MEARPNLWDYTEHVVLYVNSSSGVTVKGDEAHESYRVAPRTESNNINEFTGSIVAVALSPMPISASIHLPGGISAWKNSGWRPVDSFKKNKKFEVEYPGADSVSVPSLSGSGAIATEIVDHDEKLKPVSVMGGSDHFAGKGEMQVVPSVEAELSTLTESSEGAGRLGSLSNNGKDAGDCHMEIKPMVVDQNVLIQDNPDMASHVEQAAIAETNIECCKHVEVCAANSGSIIKEDAGVGAGAAAAPLEKNQEMKVETVKLVEVGGITTKLATSSNGREEDGKDYYISQRTR